MEALRNKSINREAISNGALALVAYNMMSLNQV